MISRIGALALATFFLLAPVASNAQSSILEKKTFEMPSYSTVAGDTIKSVKIGWEAAGTLNADKSNALDSGAKCNRAMQTGFARLCQAL
jgi:homoserine O-acetyltransferase